MIEELNSCALMYPNFCLFHDSLTKEIIGRVLKGRVVLHGYFGYSRTSNKHFAGAKERQI